MKEKKKKLFLLLAVILLLTSCSPIDEKNEVVGEIQESGKLVVATSADYPPYEFIKTIDGKGEIVGFDIQIAQYIADSWGVKLEVKDVEFESLLLGLETGMYDMVVAGMSPSPEREEKAAFSDIYYNAEHGVLVKKENKDKYKKLEDLDGKVVGVQLGSVQEDIIDEYKNIDKQALGLVTNLILELKTDKVDAILMEKPVAASYAEVNNDLSLVDSITIVDETGGSAIAMRKDELELKEEVNKIIEEIKEKDYIDEWIVEANELQAESSNTSYKNFYIQGIKITLLLSFLSLIFGFLLGMILTKMRLSDYNLVSFISKAFVELIRGTPMMVQILIVYYGSDLLGLKLSAFLASLIAVAINSGAYVSEIIRSGIEAVDRGQMEAGRSLGLSKKQTMNKIIMPQAIRNILPALGNEFVTLIKETSIASTIGVSELMFQTKKIQSKSFEGIKPLLIATVIYFILTFTLSLSMKVLERKLNHDN